MNNDKQVAGEVLSMDALLQHESFVRSVVRRLISDDAAVQDVVQSTWVQAMEHPPEARHGQRSVAAWLARVATNLVRSKQRSEGRRSYREGAVARGEWDDSWEESVERLESRQRVVEVVLTLQEPYRSVVMLRYEQGLSVEQIASRVKRSPGTVRSQLSRAHSTLRTRLDGEFGDRNSWALLAVPIGGGPWAAGAEDALNGAPSSAPAGASNGTMSGLDNATAGVKITMVAVGVLGVSLLLGGWWRFSKPEHASAYATNSNAAVGQEAELEEAQLASIELDIQKRDVLTEVQPESKLQPKLWNGPPPETFLPRAKLLSRRKYGYLPATFSFEYGTRDDPGDLTSNSWDILFRGDTLDVGVITNGLIVDLGKVALRDVHPGLITGKQRSQDVKAKLGHSYLVWKKNEGTDLVSAFEVTDLDVEDYCELDWYTVNPNGQASGSFNDDGVGPFLVESLQALQGAPQEVPQLASPRVLLQATVGHQGGNRGVINALGDPNVYFDGVSDAPLDLTEGVENHMDSLAYAEGGAIPPGMVFMVQRITYSAFRDEKGSSIGSFQVYIDQRSIVPDDYALDGSLEVWKGSIPVRPGSESGIALAASYFTRGEALIEGSFVPDTEPILRGQLASNGMFLFPRAEIPKGVGIVFGSGELITNSRTAPWPDMRFDGSRAMFQTYNMYALGIGELDHVELHVLPEETLGYTSRLQVGHRYLLTKPFQQTTLFRVEAMLPDQSCTIDWISMNHNGQMAGSHMDTIDKNLELSMGKLTGAAFERLALEKPFVHLQMQVHSQAGNSCKAAMAGRSVRLKRAPDPLPLSGNPRRGTHEFFYRKGGLIPEGKVFVVDRVEYRVNPGMEEQGRDKPIVIRVGDTYLVQETNIENRLHEVWTGRIELRPGEEVLVYIQGTRDVAAEARISGSFIPDLRSQ